MERTEYSRFDTTTMRPLEQTVYHGSGKRVLKFTYDDWGNLIKQEDTSGNFSDPNDDMVVYMGYANTNSSDDTVPGAHANPYTSYSVGKRIHDRAIFKIQESHTPVGPNGSAAVFLTETYYQYGLDNQVSEESTWDQSLGLWLVTRYEYRAEDGALAKVIKPDLSETVNEYDAHGYLARTITKNVVDAAGNQRDIMQEFGYEYMSGWKLWAKDGRGYVTEYRYDRLGRVIRTVFPDDDDDLNWNPRLGSSSTRSNNPVQVVSFDDHAYDTTVIDPLKNKTLYDYDDLGRLVNIIKYTRNGSDYTKYAETKLSYDEMGNITRIQDPNGNAILYNYDGQGNLTAVTSPDGNRKTFARNYTQRQVVVKDELGQDNDSRKTIQYLDMTDRLIKEEFYGNFAGFYAPLVTETVYDGRGNKVKEIDPRGFTTTSYYDALNRVVRVQLPEDTFRENGREVTLRPEVRYEYDQVGNKTAEKKLLPNGAWQETTFAYDTVKRQIRMAVSYTDRDGTTKTAVTETYYDANGNKVKVVDPNNTPKPASEQKAFLYEYSARGWLLFETDPAGNRTSYTYDALGNKTSVTDPRGNATPVANDYTMWLEYDALYRVVKGILPDETPEDLSDNPAVLLEYDPRGNNTKRTDPEGKVTVNTYNPRNWLLSTAVSGSGKTYTSNQTYDGVGNKRTITDPRGQVTTNTYDDLNRIKEMTLPDGSRQQFAYDQMGNRTLFVDGLYHTTRYAYNSQNKLVQVTDAKGQITQYGYDRFGNMTRQEDALDRVTAFTYDELGRLFTSIDPMGKTKTYGYDANGNRIYAQDPNQTVSTYTYSPNNLLLQLDLVGTDGRTQQLTYAYDAAGNRIFAGDGKVNLATTYDHVGRVTGETRTILADNAVYTTAYRYDKAGNLSGIQYPESGQWLEYEYNQLGELTGIPGYINVAPVYEPGGLPKSVTTANGVTTSYGWDPNGRLAAVLATSPQGEVLNLNYTYDKAGNISKRNNNSYAYDELNRLVGARVEGLFRDDAAGLNGYATKDFHGLNDLNFAYGEGNQVAIDYAAASVGTDLGQEVSGLTRIYLAKENASLVDRFLPGALEVYVAGEDTFFTRLGSDQYEITRNEDGELQLDFADNVSARYVKVHNLFDDRSEEADFTDKATFRNTLGGILTVEQKVKEMTTQYTYDAVGNRIQEDETRLQTHTKKYSYYLTQDGSTHSDLLRDDGEYAYVYDVNGNLMEKGNKYTVDGDTVTFTATSGVGVKYWKYEYDLLNRLTKVTKNGTLVAEYTYDANGFRVAAKHPQETTHYVPNLGAEALYEKETTTGKVHSYVWWNGKHLARAEGDPADTAATRYFYHLDHEGSLMVATDKNGAVAWRNDYLPYGEGIEQADKTAFEEAHGFTGKAYEEETGLYYYNARWYDPDLGRFTTADDWPVDPNSPITLNLYTYASDNPLVYLDPSGHKPIKDDAKEDLPLQYLQTGEIPTKPKGLVEIKGIKTASDQVVPLLDASVAPDFYAAVADMRKQGIEPIYSDMYRKPKKQDHFIALSESVKPEDITDKNKHRLYGTVSKTNRPHEGGLAFDDANMADPNLTPEQKQKIIDTYAAHGFVWQGEKDPVHFTAQLYDKKGQKRTAFSSYEEARKFNANNYFEHWVNKYGVYVCPNGNTAGL